MDVVGKVIKPVDRAQQRWPWLAFPYAVYKKFGDDQAGNFAALLAYYGFLSIFPLFLVAATVLGYLLHGNAALQQRILHSALVEFPVIGDQIRTTGLRGHWYVLLVSAAISLWGAQGVANSAQAALNTLWNVPFARRPGFPWRYLRSFGLLAVMGLAVLVTGFLSGLDTTGTFGVLIRALVFAVSILINIGTFTLAFRLATAPDVRLRDLLLGAVLSAVIWQILLTTGSLLVAHQIRHQQALYGTFGVVLGLLGWLYLQAQLTLYAVEADVVRTQKLWPRSVVQPPLTAADRDAYRAYAETARRRPRAEQDVDVRFSPPAASAGGDARPETSGPDRFGGA